MKSFRFKALGPVTVLTVLILCDLAPVDLRFLSHDDFQTPARIEVVPDEADLAIMEDTEPGYRVFNTQNPFNEAYTSYFHRSVGGYHAAKLRRYQDVIDRYLSRFHVGVLNMLNTKYFIVSDPASGERSVELNDGAFGPAWFVDRVRFTEGAGAELDAIGTADLRYEVIVDQQFSTLASGVSGSSGAEVPASAGSTSADPAAETNSLQAPTPPKNSIKLTEYRPNYLKYEAETSEPRMAVFSEIFYDKGWTAYLDGEPTDYLRADYILRAMVIPAGTHTVEWRFRAPNFAAVEGVTLGSSIAVLLWLAAALIFMQRKRLN